MRLIAFAVVAAAAFSAVKATARGLGAAAKALGVLEQTLVGDLIRVALLLAQLTLPTHSGSEPAKRNTAKQDVEPVPHLEVPSPRETYPFVVPQERVRDTMDI